MKSFDLNNEMQDTIENIERKHNFNPTKTQAEEILQTIWPHQTYYAGGGIGTGSITKNFIY